MRIRRTLAVVAGGLFVVTIAGTVTNEIADPTTLQTALKTDAAVVSGTTAPLPSGFHWNGTAAQSHGKTCIVIWGGRHRSAAVARVCLDGSAEVVRRQPVRTTAFYSGPSVSGDKKFCSDFTKFQNGPGYNLFTTLHADVKHTDMGFRTDWNRFQRDLLEGKPGHVLSNDNMRLTDDCTPDS